MIFNCFFIRLVVRDGDMTEYHDNLQPSKIEIEIFLIQF